MGRPKVKDRRDSQLNFSLTADELTTLKSRATAAGMHLVDYGRAMLLRDHRRTTELPNPNGEALRLQRLLHAQLSRLGNNLNQIARRLNSGGETVPMSLPILLDEIRCALRRGAHDDR